MVRPTGPQDPPADPWPRTPPVEKTLELELGPEPDAVPRARRFVRAVLEDRASEAAADAELVVSELVTNACLHGEAPITVKLRTEGPIRVEVFDSGRSAPILLQQNTESMTGRGLAMVSSLVDSWGVDIEGGGAGKTVWAELAPGGSPARRPPVPAADMADLDAILSAFPDLDGDADPDYTVRLGALDTNMLVAAKSHIDNVVRELVLVRDGQAAGGATIAPEMARLVETVTRDFASARNQIKRQASAAAARGEPLTHLELHLPLSAAAAGERYLAALEEVDRYARAARLLSVAPPRMHTVFRRWYVRALVAQLRALARGQEPPPVEAFRDVLAAEMERIPALEQVAARLELLQKLNSELADATRPDEMAALVAGNAMEFLGVLAARVFLPTDHGTLRSAASEGDRSGPDPFSEFRLEAAVPAAEVARTGRPVLLRSLREINERYPALDGHFPTDRSIHVLPVAAAGELFGVLALSFVGGEMPEDAQLAFSESLAATLASALQRSQLAVRDEEGRRALAFLTDATQIMISAPHPSQVVERLVQHAVPALADWCSVYLADGGCLRRVAVAIDGFPGLAAQLKSAPPLELHLDVPHVRAYLTGKPQLVAGGMGRLVQTLYPGVDLAGLGGDPGHGTGMCVPIRVREERIGVIAMAFLGSGRAITAQVTQTLAQLGARAALALDNAQGRDAQQRMVQGLVAALLPSQPPRVDGLEFAARYLPAGGDVAGDWWEADTMPDGTILVGLGDAAGHGMAAMTQMCELRHGARALAAVEASPSALLADLNRRLAAIDAGFATAFYSRLDPATGALRWASAGHVPPLLARADGTVSVLNRRGGAPLGTPDVPPGPDTPLTLEPGDTLVLYSDGVIERRYENLDVGLDRLVATVAAHAGGSPDRLADAIVVEHCVARVDDCCLLVVRRSAVPAAPRPEPT